MICSARPLGVASASRISLNLFCQREGATVAFRLRLGGAAEIAVAMGA